MFWGTCVYPPWLFYNAEDGLERELQRTEYNNTILTFDVQKPGTAVWHLVKKKKKMTFGGKETHNTEQSKEVLNKSVSARQRKSLTDAFNKI